MLDWLHKKGGKIAGLKAHIQMNFISITFYLFFTIDERLALPPIFKL